MRLGLIVRCDDTGLGNQTWEMWRWLKPEVTVGVDMSRIPGKMPQHRDRYRGVVWTTWKGVGFAFDNRQAYQILTDCDVVLSVETFYDQRIAQEIPNAVLYVNPELYRGYEANHVWVPTDWRLDQLPGATVMPFPVAADHPYKRGEGFLHVAGVGAAYDRNGTQAAARAAARAKVELTVTTQTDLPKVGAAHRVTHVDRYWQLYEHGDVLVMPRRYGGMCLPTQEALAAGLAVVMTDTVPNRMWPVHLVPAAAGQPVRTVPKTTIQTVDVDEDGLVETLRTVDDWRWDLEPERLAWLEQWRWENQTTRWREALTKIAE